jgi:hypothetical protein
MVKFKVGDYAYYDDSVQVEGQRPLQDQISGLGHLASIGPYRIIAIGEDDRIAEIALPVVAYRRTELRWWVYSGCLIAAHNPDERKLTKINRRRSEW